MQINWLCLNGTFKNRKKDEKLNLTFDLDYGSSNCNNFIPQVIEGTNLKDTYVYTQKETFSNIIKAVFCEGCKPKMVDIPLIEILARQGYAYFWNMEDLLWFLKFANKLILNSYDIADLMIEVERSNHSAKVTQLCCQVGEVLGMKDFAWEDVLYHDIGKIAIPQSLLFTPRYYTDVEKHFVRTHVLHGSYLIEQLNLDGAKRLFALYHHEKYDGSGYYKGFSRGEIPKPVRVLTACDVYEALSSHRSYRTALDVEIIDSFMTSKKGTWFDPEVVDALIECVMQKKYSEERSYRI